MLNFFPCVYITGYLQLKLLRSVDVELNPGPLTDKEKILNAVRTSKEQVLPEIKSVRDEVTPMRSEVDAVRRDCADVKAKFPRANFLFFYVKAGLSKKILLV